MERELIQTRKHFGEAYEFYYEYPSYKGEVGILGVELKPRIEVVTPANGFGYPNYIWLDKEVHWNDNGKFDGYVRCPVVLERWERPSLVKALTKQIVSLEKKLGINDGLKTIYDV